MHKGCSHCVRVKKLNVGKEKKNWGVLVEPHLLVIYVILLLISPVYICVNNLM